ncbi:MAG: hypothetical protein ACLQUT_12150, partial [Thermoleophilia bacterium]
MFLEYLIANQRFQELAPRLRRGASVYAPSFMAAYVLAGLLATHADMGWLVVAADAEAAAKLAAELAVYLEREVAVLPARGVFYGADVAAAA